MKPTKYLLAFLAITLSLSLSTQVTSGIYRDSGGQPFSVITEGLMEIIDNSSENDIVPVFIWTNDVETDLFEKESLEQIGMSSDQWEKYLEDTPDSKIVDQYICVKRSVAASMYNAHNDEFIDKNIPHEKIIFKSQYSPMVAAELTVTRILELSRLSTIECIDYYEDVKQNCAGLAKQILKANQVHTYSGYGYTGSGVKIGMIEISLPDTTAYNYITHPGSMVYDGNPFYADHANVVLEILKTVAPNAAIYCTDNQLNSYEQIEWLISQGVNIINASCFIGGDYNNFYGAVSKWLDHIAYQHDVHLVVSAGNYHEEDEPSYGFHSGAMAYNVITVGNLNDRRTLSVADDIISPNSPYYLSPSLLTGPMKPDICAPATNLISNIGNENYYSGTSFAAPQVAGAIALLCQQNAALKTRQDVVKAILQSSVNFDSPHTYEPTTDCPEYLKYGAGLLNCYSASWVVKNSRFAYSWLSSSTSQRSYTFNVTSADDRIRVALAFVVKSQFGSGVNHILNNPSVPPSGSYYSVYLEIFEPGSTVPIVMTPRSGFMNVEIIDFEPNVTGTYTIKVVLDHSPDNKTYFGIAWR